VLPPPASARATPSSASRKMTHALLSMAMADWQCYCCERNLNIKGSEDLSC
jgi:hypothetical protein